MAEPSDIIAASLSNDALAVQAAVNSILTNKLDDYLAQKKVEVANKLFTPDNEE